MKILDTDNKEETLQYLHDLISYTIKLEHKIGKAIQTIKYYANENDDCGKIYNDEEKELLDILEGDDEKWN